MPEGIDGVMQRLLQRTYAISHPVRVYETYCEIWARILNVMFDCFTWNDETTGDGSATPLQLQVFMECVMEGLRANAEFAQRQCAKILHYADLSHDIIANPSERNRAIVAEKYRENTNVFAYYVLTHILLHSPEAFMVWCYKNNPFARTKKNIMQFRTIVSNFNGFMELLRHCKQQYSHSHNDVRHHDADVLGSSMRMTVYVPMHE
jgi:hypothetical protein